MGQPLSTNHLHTSSIHICAITCRSACEFCCFLLQPVLLVWHTDPVKPLQHVRQLHTIASRYHGGHPEAGVVIVSGINLQLAADTGAAVVMVQW